MNAKENAESAEGEMRDAEKEMENAKKEEVAEKEVLTVNPTVINQLENQVLLLKELKENLTQIDLIVNPTAKDQNVNRMGKVENAEALRLRSGTESAERIVVVGSVVIVEEQNQIKEDRHIRLGR